MRTIKCWTQLQSPGVEHDRIQEEGVGVMMILPTTQYLHIFSESNCPVTMKINNKTVFIDWCYSVPGLHWSCVNQIMKKCGGTADCRCWWSSLSFTSLSPLWSSNTTSTYIMSGSGPPHATIINNTRFMVSIFSIFWFIYFFILRWVNIGHV